MPVGRYGILLANSEARDLPTSRVFSTDIRDPFALVGLTPGGGVTEWR